MLTQHGNVLFSILVATVVLRGDSTLVMKEQKKKLFSVLDILDRKRTWGGATVSFLPARSLSPLLPWLMS